MIEEMARCFQGNIWKQQWRPNINNRPNDQRKVYAEPGKGLSYGSEQLALRW